MSPYVMQKFKKSAIRQCLSGLRIIAILLFAALWFVAIFNKNSRVIYVMPDVFVNHTSHLSESSASKAKLHHCRPLWDSLHLRQVDVINAPSLSDVEAANEEFVRKGGKWSPDRCIPRQRVAIIIPYQNRWSHLRILLNRLHPMLRKQLIHYQIFLVDQVGSAPFNRGMLMNIGVNEALKRENFDCFIFQDVDMIPEHDRNIYLCDAHMRHLSSAIDEMRYHLMYDNFAGGVVALTRENIFKINGFPNLYWGPGSIDDDDLSARTMAAGLKISRPPPYVGRFKMIRHVKAPRFVEGIELFLTWRHRQFKDGLNSLSPSNYHIVSVKSCALFTHISVDLSTPSQKVLRDRLNGPRESYYWFLKFYGWIP